MTIQISLLVPTFLYYACMRKEASSLLLRQFLTASFSPSNCLTHSPLLSSLLLFIRGKRQYGNGEREKRGKKWLLAPEWERERKRGSFLLFPDGTFFLLRRWSFNTLCASNHKWFVWFQEKVKFLYLHHISIMIHCGISNFQCACVQYIRVFLEYIPVCVL